MHYQINAVFVLFLFCLSAFGNPPAEKKSDAVQFKIRLVSKSGEISFDQNKLSAPYGKKIVLTYINEAGKDSEILHDVAILKRGMENTVTASLIKNKYDISKVDGSLFLAQTKVLKPGESDTIYFQPTEPGDYTYICLMPGHLTMMGMKGILTVEKSK